ncbi:hypothetical protein [Paenibacillus polymyxa]|uniref:hypothetical protein n=1 Tax=Paenibacillus polymyxa TaxID=1406 RepID=UPI0021552C0E|nr:hypothetical protein [Paenibacillus polymyxa]
MKKGESSHDSHSALKIRNQSITKFKKNESQGQVIWKEKNITLTAKKTELKNAPSTEKNLITSITIKKGEKIYTIHTDKFDDKLRDISSVSICPSSNWLAIQTRRSAGETVLLVDMKNGKHQVLNDQLSAAGKKNIETINSYNWSPKADQIAFSYGDTSTSSIAIYNPQKGEFTFLPRETDYILYGILFYNHTIKHRANSLLAIEILLPTGDPIKFFYGNKNEKETYIDLQKQKTLVQAICRGISLVALLECYPAHQFDAYRRDRRS